MTSPMPALHLLTVWNPSYTDDALDAHLSLLLDLVRRRDAGEIEDEDIYVWWGKIRSRNRDGRLPHHDRVVAIDEQIRGEEETHLYLTDYRSLYVADVGEITDEDVRGREPGGTVPAYYDGHAIDFWFRLWDIRRLVTDDTPAVIEELKKLRNTGYHDRPVSLYGGVVDLPLIVFREPEASWFGDRDLLTEGRRWAERAAAQRSETERTSRDLRDNLFGRELWPRLGATTRSFLASAEAVFRARRDDAGFDLSGAALEYAKAVEAELNGLLFPAFRRALGGKAPADREVRVDARTLDLGGPVSHQTLGALCNLLDHEPVVQTAVRQQFPADHKWLLGVLPGQLRKLASFRNAGAHAEITGAGELAELRRWVVGVGEEGLVARLVRAGMRGR
jgi:hypothetical protein